MRSRFPVQVWPSAFLAFVPALGCTDEQAIGALCARGVTICIEADGGLVPPLPEADSARDGGSMSAPSASDSAVPVDSGIVGSKGDAETPLTGRVFPSQLQNEDSAITSPGQSPGDVVAIALPLAGAQIDPWFTCQPIGGGDNPTTAVRAEKLVTLNTDETPPFSTVEPPSGVPGDSFISIRYLVALVNMPLVQHLSAPLRKGQQYVVVASVQSGNVDAELSLQLRAANSESDLDVCLDPIGQVMLAETDPITSVGWQTVCLPFTAPDDYTYLGLAVKSRTLTAARLFVDSLRAPLPGECPGL